MIVRVASLLIAALTLPAAPALAQDDAGEASATQNDTAVPPLPEAAAVEPAIDPAPEPMAGPAPVAAPAYAAPPPPSPFAPDQRAGWLAQCRSTFQRAGAALGGGNGLPDACETQLLDFERSYVARPDGQPPVIWVRVPIARAAPAMPAASDEDVDSVADPDAGTGSDQ